MRGNMMENIKNYEEAVAYILEVPKFTKKNSPQQTKEFYEYLQRPGSGSKIIHVAGTNGKGSVCAYLQSIFFEAKLSTAMFTSPHLVDMRERFQVDKEMVPEEEFLELFFQLRKSIISFQDKVEGEQKMYHPTFFEFMFFIGMMWFEEKKVEVIILETGLGGRLDATNSVVNKAVSVITQIGLDHMEYLGHTIEEIAYEKAGIIKENTPLLFIEQEEAIERVLVGQANRLGTSYRKVSKIKEELIIYKEKSIDFSENSRYYKYIDVILSTTARYQVDNANLAIAVVEELFKGEKITKEEIKSGLQKMVWGGRMEEILPHVFLDGAHNENGMEAFLKTVENDGCVGNRYLFFSAVADKEYGLMADKLLQSHLFTTVGTAPIKNARALKEEQLKELFKNQKHVEIFADVETGFAQYVKAKQENDRVYIVGSLYLVGEIKCSNFGRMDSL